MIFILQVDKEGWNTGIFRLMEYWKKGKSAVSIIINGQLAVEYGKRIY